MQSLLTNATANGAGAVVPGVALAYAEVKTAWAWGTFDGATVTFQASPDGVEWFDLLDADDAPLAFTAKGCENVECRGGHFRAVVSSAGASTSLQAAIT